MTNWPVQSRTPFLDALKTQANAPQTPFYFPGHKRGGGIAEPLKDWLGDAVFQGDLPELPKLDNLFQPQGPLRDAQDLAAAAFGAQQTWFLTNGSTAGVMAAILATCHPGEKLALARNSHQCAIAGLILAGVEPVFIQPEYDATWDIALRVSPEALETTLNQHSDIKAVLVVSPTYHGVCSDIAPLADCCHRHQIPLIVDEAHGAHLGFHPQLPPSALQSHADLVIQSTHKSLTALSQGAMLHSQGDRISRQRLQASLPLVQSTSPNSLILASLDMARQQIATQGHQHLQACLDLAQQVRSHLSQLPAVALSPHADDPTRLTLRLGQQSGYHLDEQLAADFGVLCELPQQHHLTFALTIGNHPIHGEELLQAITQLAQAAPTPAPLALSPLPPLPPMSLTPRQAHFAPKETLPRHQALGRISGELICPYPPGIPLLIPGERITESALTQLSSTLAAGGLLTGCQDITGEHLQVIARTS
ncbi:aminotransferase class I/II-fold pyridoxal phosphate-dependent enzyme [Phormidium yuhuli AB48]|uniref:Aminotransferase class I/II-fold pyridoxal phosphate-dependent enzyme n=1 Tax=Phormidium yuhuli AB48 TaxID=2940671 RepID=A0ABY5ARS9_9CYAN|nr:aminotransferase class I/II-fold pyridoxal phosphate-dependent enzyme [Phormidium yuhuli]USR91919.1 aminotransferase class I/II-fold pyridoxal phosphate-dependent enzyme [Phormidium yuhuli AB48]